MSGPMNSVTNTLRDAMRRGEARLAVGPHAERARQDASALLRAVVGKDQAALMTHWDEPLPASLARRFAALLERRFKGEPMQYILGKTEFYGLSFRVTPQVLIPRPETEHLVEAVIERATRMLESTSEADSGSPPELRIADVGTGSGVIAVTLARELATAQITAIDRSLAALTVARENAALHGVSDRLRLMGGDLLTPVAGERFEIIASNPPYVPARDRTTLAVEVREYEPSMALFAGADGLDIYRRLIPSAAMALVPAGWLVLEIGFGQAASVEALLVESGFQTIQIVADLQGIPRVVCAMRAGVSAESGAGVDS